MEAEDTVEMSSVLVTDEVEETISLPKEINSEESCSFLKSQDEDVTVYAGSNQSSVSIIEQPSSSSMACDRAKVLTKPSKTALNQDSESSPVLGTPTGVNSENEVVVDVGDGQDLDSLHSAEIKPNEPIKKSSLNQVSSDILGRAVGGDSAGSGESITGRQNGQVRSVSPEQSIGDTSIQGHLLEGNRVSVCGKSTDKVPAQTRPNADSPFSGLRKCGSSIETSSQGEEIVMPDIVTQREAVVTIMKPKTHSVDVASHGEGAVERVRSENLGQPPPRAQRNFFLADIVSGRLDLGDKAEVLDDLIYWRNPKKTGFIFVGGVSMLVSMQYYSLISVMAYLSLVFLLCGFMSRLCSAAPGSTCNPLVELSPALSEESLQRFTDHLAYFVNDTMLAMRRLYLVEDVVHSVKFGLVLWYLTYVGLWFNGMTIVTICFVTIFTVPNLYKHNKEMVDEQLTVFWKKWLNLSEKARAASQESLVRILSFEKHDKIH